MKLVKISKILLVGSFISFSIGFLLTSYPIAALAWNIIFPKTSAKLAKILSKPITNREINTLNTNSSFTLPDKDTSLTLETRIIIPKIGVNTIINEETLEGYENALIKGVWRVPNFGIPIKKGPPVILVAHRFGYLNWNQNYRETNSFFNLPNLSEGDSIEIIWDQRKFTYEITSGEDGEQISNYNADLILYTCKFLKSDIRIFRYARLIK